jgi:hypothetical protein
MIIEVNNEGVQPQRLHDEDIGLTLYTPRPLALGHGINEVVLNFDISFDDSEYALILSKKKMAGKGIIVIDTGIDRREYTNFSILVDVRNELGCLLPKGTAIATLVVLQNVFQQSHTYH